MSTSRRPLIAGNWKMNGLKKDAKQLASQLAKHMIKKNKPSFDMVVCPPTPLLGLVAETLKGSGVKMGTQDNHQATSGAIREIQARCFLKILAAHTPLLVTPSAEQIMGKTIKPLKPKQNRLLMLA